MSITGLTFARCKLSPALAVVVCAPLSISTSNNGPAEYICAFVALFPGLPHPHQQRQ